MNLRELTLQAAVLRVLADEIASRLALVKEAAKQSFDDAGSASAKARLPDGTPVATVTLAGGDGKTAAVVNEAAFLAWMKASHPEEVVEVVRPNAARLILDGCKAAGAPVDPATGEVIPGVEVTGSRPYVSVRFTSGGRDAIVDAWQAGQLAGVELVAPREIEGSDAA